MSNVPCLNPQLCKVKSHNPGTDSLCKQPGLVKPSVKNPINSLKVQVSSVPFTSREIEKQTKAFQSMIDRSMTMTQGGLDQSAKDAASYERQISMARDPKFRELAWELKSKYHSKSLAIPMVLQDAGYGHDRNDEGRAETLVAEKAVRMVRSGGGSEIVYSKANRALNLSFDPYIREHSDSVRIGNEEGDLEGMAEATDKMRGRMLEIGVPEDEVEDLLPAVYEQASEAFERKMLNLASLYPAADMQMWEPFRVEDALKRSEQTRL